MVAVIKPARRYVDPDIARISREAAGPLVTSDSKFASGDELGMAIKLAQMSEVTQDARWCRRIANLIKAREAHNLRKLSSIRRLKDILALGEGEETTVVAWLNPDDGKLTKVVDQIGVTIENALPLFLQVTRQQGGLVISEIDTSDLVNGARQYLSEWKSRVDMRLPQTIELPALTLPDVNYQQSYNDQQLINLHHSEIVTSLLEGKVLVMHAVVDKKTGQIQVIEVPKEYLNSPDDHMAELHVVKGAGYLDVRWADLSDLEGMDPNFLKWYQRGTVRVTKPNGHPSVVELVPEDEKAIPTGAGFHEDGEYLGFELHQGSTAENIDHGARVLQQKLAPVAATGVTIAGALANLIPG